MKKYIIGVDIGGSNIKAGLVLKGSIIKRYSVKTESEKGKKVVIENIIKAIMGVFTSNVLGIGVGSPGPSDYKKGIII